jgi:hypothetical protein
VRIVVLVNPVRGAMGSLVPRWLVVSRSCSEARNPHNITGPALEFEDTLVPLRGQIVRDLRFRNVRSTTADPSENSSPRRVLRRRPRLARISQWEVAGGEKEMSR